MNRRQFLTTVGGGFIGLTSATGLIGASGDSQPKAPEKSVTVNIYQTKSLSTQISQADKYQTRDVGDIGELWPDDMEITYGDSKQSHKSKTEQTILACKVAEDEFEMHFDNVSFDFKFKDFTVPLSLDVSVYDYVGKIQQLKKWSDYTSADESGEINLLLASNLYDDSEGGTFGLSTPNIPIVDPYDKHGIVWIDEESERTPTVIAHEIGHMIGLNHYHGTKISDSEGSVMYSRKFAEQVKTNIYGESLLPKAPINTLQFNEKLTTDNLDL